MSDKWIVGLLINDVIHNVAKEKRHEGRGDERGQKRGVRERLPKGKDDHRIFYCVLLISFYIFGQYHPPSQDKQVSYIIIIKLF